MSGTCPACGSVNTTTAHLIYEYCDFMRCTGGRNMFYRNARMTQDAVARMLFARGITEIPNIFGPIAIELWYPLWYPLSDGMWQPVESEQSA